MLTQSVAPGFALCAKRESIEGRISARRIPYARLFYKVRALDRGRISAMQNTVCRPAPRSHVWDAFLQRRIPHAHAPDHAKRGRISALAEYRMPKRGRSRGRISAGQNTACLLRARTCFGRRSTHFRHKRNTVCLSYLSTHGATTHFRLRNTV